MLLYTKDFNTEADAEDYKISIDHEPSGNYYGVVVVDVEGFIVEVWKDE